MTRKRARNTAAGLGVIAGFFALIAFFAGFHEGQHLAYGAGPDLFHDETPDSAKAQRLAAGGPHRPACSGGFGWGGHTGPASGAFCHPFFKAAPGATRPRLAAAERTPGAPRRKTARTLDDAVASMVAREAGLSRPQGAGGPDALRLALAPQPAAGSGDGRAPTVPRGVGLAPLSPWALMTPGAGGDNIGDGPAPETPDEPEMPLPPLDPVGPDPVGPIYPGGPDLPTDPIVTPIPGAAVLWIAGLAALGATANRKRRA